MTIYVVSTDDSGAYKIGYAEDWTKRQVQYLSHAYQPVLHALDLSAGRHGEAFMHRLFKHKKAPTPPRILENVRAGYGRREWFLLDDDDLDLIRGLFEGPGLWSVSSLEGSGPALLRIVTEYVKAWDAKDL
jgi:hypothetical protein